MANTAVTLGSTYKYPLTLIGEAASGYNFKATIPYTQVNTGTGSSDTVTVTLGNTPAKWFIDKAVVNVTTAFTGTTAFSIIVGTTTTTNAIVASTDLIAGGAGIIPMASTVPISTNLKGTSALSLVATFTNATGGSPSAVTAGSLDIYLNIVDTTLLG